MAGGTVTLLWYGLCFGFVALSVGIAIGLVLYGERADRKRRGSHQPPPEPEQDPPTGD